MTSRQILMWFTVVAVILVLWGIMFSVFGLGVFADLGIMAAHGGVLLAWESAFYGAIMIGLGHHARTRRQDSAPAP